MAPSWREPQPPSGWSSGGLVQNLRDDLVHPNPHLPASALLLLRGLAAPHARVVLGVPAGHIPQGISDALHALGLQDLDQAGDAVALDLLEGTEMGL